MKLYLIENDKTIDTLLNSDAYAAGTDVIICFNYLVLLRMQREGHQHRVVFLEELLDSSDYKQLHAATDAFAMEWYKVGGKDITLFDGTSFGMLVENMFPRKYMLNILVKIGEVMRRAVEQWSSAEAFYCDFTNHGNMQRHCEGGCEQFFDKVGTVALVAHQLGMPVHTIAAPNVIPPMWLSRHRTVSQKVRLKAKLKRWFLRGINTLGVPARILPRTAVFVFGYYNLQSLQPGKGKRLITDNYQLFRHSPNLLFSGGQVLNLDEVPISLGEPAVEFLHILKSRVKAEDFWRTDDAYTLNGISYRELYKPAIIHIAESVIPDLLRTMRQMRRSIRAHDIEKVLFIDTIDTISRARIQACRQEGCKTMVVYHGLFDNVSQQESVKRRIPPDILITPGDPKHSPQYVENFIVPPRRVLAHCGSPIIDQYPASARKRVASIKKVLFLTMNDGFYCNLSRFPYQEKYLAEIMSTFGALADMGIDVHFRAHPGENTAYNQYLLDFFNIDQSKIHYSNSGAFRDVIYDMDLMVTNISTVFFESQAAGVPTVFLDPLYSPEAVQAPLNGVHGEEVLRIATGEELLSIIRRNQHDPAELNTFLDTFLKRYAPHYVGPIDGQAGVRIGEYLAGSIKPRREEPVLADAPTTSGVWKL